MLDEEWFRWAHFISLFAKSSIWLKSTTATRYEDEPDSIKEPMIAHGGRIMRWVWATCPHCHEEIVYRWMLGGAPSVKFFAPLCLKCGKGLRINFPEGGKVGSS